MKPAFSTAERHQYQEQGFLVLRQIIPASRIKALVTAVERLIDRAVTGNVRPLKIDRRVSGAPAAENQIQWIGDPQNRIPARLMYLLLGDRFNAVYADWFDAELLPLLEALLESPARYSLFGMLAAGGGKPYAQPWHHDWRSPDNFHPAVILDPEPFWFVQFNAPLKPNDRFLQIIPASHNRRATPAEIEAYQRDPQGDFPGQMIVAVEPGDLAIYNPNLWHRGWNPNGELRWTMHGTVWRADFAVMEHEAGQREPIEAPGYLAQLPPLTRALMQRYLDAYPAGKPATLAEAIQRRRAAAISGA